LRNNTNPEQGVPVAPPYNTCPACAG
jgi:hypothetical protein